MKHAPLVQPISPGGYMLMGDFPHRYGSVPAGLDIDGASVPPFGWILTYTPWHPIVLGPSIPHDWLYLTHAVTRAEADLQFYEMLLENGADEDRAEAMYSAVKIAGRYFWTQTEADIRRLHFMRGMCRGRLQFESYGFPEVI